MNRKKQIENANPYSGNNAISINKKFGFTLGAEWADEHPVSPWIDINDRSVTIPNDKMCLLRLEDGTIVRDTEEWEDVYQLLVTHWMPIPSFDGIIESNKDVLNRMKEKGENL